VPIAYELSAIVQPTRVFQHRHVERLERDGGLESFHRRMKVPGARRRQAQVVVRPDVPGVALGCESEVAGGLGEGPGVVRDTPQLQIILDHGIA